MHRWRQEIKMSRQRRRSAHGTTTRGVGGASEVTEGGPGPGEHVMDGGREEGGRGGRGENEERG